MARRRSIPSVLHNFLGTLCSRYSDFDGYWIFGLVVSGLRRSTIDLLVVTPMAHGSPSWDALVRLARSRFANQAKASSVMSFVRRAELTIDRGPPRSEAVGGLVRSGYEVTLAIEALTDLGRSFRRETSLFVAPHDPATEGRSVRRGIEAAMQHGERRQAEAGRQP